MVKGWELQADEVLGSGKLLLEPETVEKLSKDYYWYSPLLEKRLKDKSADGAVKAQSEDDVARTLAFAYQHGIPITPRGAGTGNYGQAIPLEGGILLDVSGLSSILEIGEGFVRCQCGVKMGALEKAVRETGQELRIYPSTINVATIGGFISGGSGGIGSITWGSLWDGNVLEAVIYTMEETPRRLVVQGEELTNYIHSYGTTGILTEVVIPLTTAKEWQESVCQFDTLEDAVRFCDEVAHDASFAKRLISLSEWPLPGYFTPLARQLERDAAAVLLEVEAAALDTIEAHAKQAGGRLGYVKPKPDYRKGICLTDFTWNHTTLWSIKADPAYTYLQAAFSRTTFRSQIDRIKTQYGDEVLLHLEWTKGQGEILPIMLPVIRFTTEERLYEIIGYLESIGVSVANPHIWSIKDNGDMGVRKQRNDPLGLLNPGKLEGKAVGV